MRLVLKGADCAQHSEGCGFETRARSLGFAGMVREHRWPFERSAERRDLGISERSRVTVVCEDVSNLSDPTEISIRSDVDQGKHVRQFGSGAKRRERLHRLKKRVGDANFPEEPSKEAFEFVIEKRGRKQGDGTIGLSLEFHVDALRCVHRIGLLGCSVAV